MMHEIHVTVPPEQIVDLRRFVDVKFPVTESTGPFRVKVHHFVNHAHPPIQDVMTGECCTGDLQRVNVVAGYRANQMRRFGLDVLRVKVDAEAADHRSVSGHVYYETHLEILGHTPSARVGVSGVLISTSVRTGKVHATIRSRTCTYEQHVARVNRKVHGLLANCIQAVGSPRHEAVLIDSAPEHDARWEGAT